MSFIKHERVIIGYVSSKYYDYKKLAAYGEAWDNSPIGRMIVGLGNFADAYYVRYGQRLGTDPVIGAAWFDTLKAIHALLNGDLSGIDCGLTDNMMREMAEIERFNPNDI